MNEPFDDSEAERRFLMHAYGVLRRLRVAGLVTHFEEAPGPGGEMQIQWTEHYKPPLGGRTALICFAALLDEICHEGPLSVEDQQSLILLGEMLSGIDPTKSAKRLSKWTAA